MGSREYLRRNPLFRNVFETGMHKLLKKTLLSLVLAASVPAWASTATDFYLDLLKRGTSEVDAGRYNTSVTPLRLAAFGLVDSIEHYETAQAYLAVALDKLGQQEEARRAAQRVVAAEAVEKKFATLALPPPIRTAFNAVAKKLLSGAEATSLSAPAPAQPASQPRQTGPAIVPPPNRTPAKTTTAAATPPTTPPQTATQSDPPKQAPPPQVQNNSAQKPAASQKTAGSETPKTAVPPPGQNGGAQTSAVNERAEQSDPPKVAPVPKPATTAPIPAAKTTTPPATKPQTTPQITPQTPRVDVPARLQAGERALASSNLVEARRIYGELLAVPSLERSAIIRIGEGLYRSRDFPQALNAFLRLGTLRSGEEAYRYYIAVALFETGDIAAAKREMSAALPFIEITPDVQRYRQRVESAPN